MKRILLPVDISLISDKAIQIATEIALENKSVLVFLFVGEGELLETTPICKNVESQKISADFLEIKKTISSLVHLGIKIEEHYCCMEDFNCISNCIENHQIDLIVLATEATSNGVIKNILSDTVISIIEKTTIPLIAIDDFENEDVDVSPSYNKNVVDDSKLNFVYMNNPFGYCKSNILLLHYKSMHSLYFYMPVMTCISEFAKQNVLERMFSILKIRQFA
jgi:nucleotide-binding universal stress UspA family protein